MAFPNQTLVRTTDVLGDKVLSELGNSGEDIFANDLEKLGKRLRSPGLLTISGLVLTVGNTTIETGPSGRQASLSVVKGVDLGGLTGTFDFATGTGTGDVQSAVVPSVAANFYVKAGIEVRQDRKIYVVFGTSAASIATAGSPGFGKTSAQLGLVVLQRNAGNTAFVSQTDNSGIRQFGSGSGGGSGSGQGFFNYVTNPDAEVDTTGWNGYNDGANATPIDGTGGTPTITLSRVSSTPLFETGSFRISKPASNCQGQGVSTELTTVNSSDAGRIWEFKMAYGVSSDFVTGDVTVHIFDKTNNQVIAVFSLGVLKQTDTNSKGLFRGLFAPNRDQVAAREFRAIVHIATTNATTWTLDYDNVEIRPYAQEDALITEAPVAGGPVPGQVAAFVGGAWTVTSVPSDVAQTRLAFVQADLGGGIYQLVEKGRIYNAGPTAFTPGAPYWFNGAGFNEIPKVGREPIFVAETARTAIFEGLITRNSQHENANRVLRSSPFQIAAGGTAVLTGVLEVSGATVAVAASTQYRSGKYFHITFANAGEYVDFYCDVRDMDFGQAMSVGTDFSIVSGAAPALFVFQNAIEISPDSNAFPTVGGLVRDFVRSVNLLTIGQPRVRIKATGAGVVRVDGVRLQALSPVQVSGAYQSPQTYTTTLTNATASSQALVHWRENHLLRIKGRVTLSGAPTGVMKMSLPANFNAALGTFGLAATNADFGEVQAYNTLGWDQGRALSDGSSTTTVVFVGDDGVGNWDANTPFAWANTHYFEVDLSIPVSEYAGTTGSYGASSELYPLINTDETAANNTSAFGQNIRGVLFPNIVATGTAYSKDVRLPRDLQAGDDVQLVVFAPNSEAPIEHEEVFPEVNVGGVIYGMAWTRLNANTIRVTFNAGGAETDASLFSTFRSAGWTWAVFVRTGVGTAALSPATPTNPGYVSTTAQSYGGAKTFVDALAAQKSAVVVYTGTTTLTTADAGKVIYANSASAFSLNLPTAVGNDGLTFEIKSLGTGLVTIDPNAAELIDGASTHVLSQYDSTKIVAFGGAWYVH
jgi:hypothetical protein